MAVPKPNLHPTFNIVRLSHLEFTVKSLRASREFYVDALGLQVTEESSAHICLRALEERGHHSILLRQGDESVTGALAFKVCEDCDLDQAQLFFEKKAC